MEQRYWTVQYERCEDEGYNNEIRIFEDEAKAEHFADDVYAVAYESDKHGNPRFVGTNRRAQW